MSCFWCVKLSFLEKKEFHGFLKKRLYLQKYKINFDETKSLLLLKECSLRISIWILKFHIENSQEWTKHGRYQVFWDALYLMIRCNYKLGYLKIEFEDYVVKVTHLVLSRLSVITPHTCRFLRLYMLADFFRTETNGRQYITS